MEMIDSIINQRKSEELKSDRFGMEIIVSKASIYINLRQLKSDRFGMEIKNFTFYKIAFLILLKSDRFGMEIKYCQVVTVLLFC